MSKASKGEHEADLQKSILEKHGHLVNDEHFSRIINDPKEKVENKIQAIHRFKFKDENKLKSHINNIMSKASKGEHEEDLKKYILTYHGHLVNDEHLSRIINDPNEKVENKIQAIRHFKDPKELETHINRIINDPKEENYLKWEAISNIKDPKELQKLAENSDDPFLHKRIINHENVHTDTLHTIAEKSDNPNVHQEILNHPNVHPDTLHEIAKKSNNSSIHQMILKHPKVQQKTKDLINSK